MEHHISTVKLNDFLGLLIPSQGNHQIKDLQLPLKGDRAQLQVTTKLYTEKSNYVSLQLKHSHINSSPGKHVYPLDYQGWSKNSNNSQKFLQYNLVYDVLSQFKDKENWVWVG